MFSEQYLHEYGTPLPLLEIDQIPSKKPVHVQDQIATDDQGRRRFHGAFTGGFSAGYWNTVGSKEGWTPKSFKSSRTEKAAGKLTQKPEDFMDDEDLGEFGIAPKGLQINEDFTSIAEQGERRKRKFLQNDLHPIPGEPVLHQLIKPIKDKAAVRILKSWGWKPGQGIGPRQTKKEKRKARERNKKEMYLIEKYGCDLPGKSNVKDADTDDEEDDDESEEDDEITFAPEDYEIPPLHIKDNKFGIGYEPLSRQSVLGGPSSSTSQGHLNLFKPLEAVGKNNQKISFTGQAFGVGALEDDDDEDVYALDDMTRYDFTLEDKKTKKTIEKTTSDLEELTFGEFILDRSPHKLPVYKVDIPFGWKPRNWHERKSRFEPLDPNRKKNLEKLFPDSSTQQEMTREKRAELLGKELTRAQTQETINLKSKTVEELQREYKERNEKTKTLLEKITAKSSGFIKGGLINVEGEEKPYSEEDVSSAFKPFATDEKKQQRYEQFLTKEFKSEHEIEEFLKTLQPVELSLWDRQMELKEFQQAKKLYRPLTGVMSDRFITESEIKAVKVENKKNDDQQIVVERTKVMWKPHSLLCKRYNIAEPFKGLMEDNQKSKIKQKKMSVFDYLETSVNKKEDFQTPVIVPKNIEKLQEIVKQTNITDKEKTDGTATLEWQKVLNPSDTQPSTKEKKTFTFKPTNDLEKKVLECRDKPAAEKMELFKSIFSSSESDNDEVEESDTIKNELRPVINKPINAAAANLLRNDSPPRGIFKALFTTTKTSSETNINKETELQEKPAIQTKDATCATPTENTKIFYKPKSSREPKESQDDLQSSEVYGPVLPKTMPNKSLVNTSTHNSPVDDKLLDLFNKHKSAIRLSEKWVEKGAKNTDFSDSEDSSLSSPLSEEVIKHKKKSKKTKKKKSNSDHKLKKQKADKANKKSKKHDKKKKKNKNK